MLPSWIASRISPASTRAALQLVDENSAGSHEVCADLAGAGAASPDGVDVRTFFYIRQVDHRFN